MKRKRMDRTQEFIYRGKHTRKNICLWLRCNSKAAQAGRGLLGALRSNHKEKSRRRGRYWNRVAKKWHMKAMNTGVFQGAYLR